MMNKNMSKVSRLLSNVLRHKPDNIGIKLDKNGWTSVEVLLAKLREYSKGVTMEELEEIVETNNKKRFAFNDDKSKIRASQGHSVPVDLELPNTVPPMKLYHGTIDKSVELILKNGMSKMKRHAIHLSVDVETAINVGSRRGDAIILEISSGFMFSDGYKFQVSDNGVWLTDEVPSKYITIKK